MSEIIEKGSDLTEHERQQQVKMRGIRMRSFIKQKWQLEKEKKDATDRLKVVQAVIDECASEISQISNGESMEGMQLLFAADATPYPV